MGEDEILSAAQKLPNNEREAFLEQACGGDEKLKQRIRETLQSDESKFDETKVYDKVQQPDDDSTRDWQQSGDIHEFPQNVVAGADSTNLALPGSPEEKLIKGDDVSPGDLIGPYKLLKPLGQGGMGEVWMAEQSEPVKRQVALKVIKRGIGSKEILARFEAERQALSLMNHPNIARILDAGATPDGQPYFAMELVKGRPLTTYCDENRLSINERLALFADVCNGVQHAHQKGIIHRDLKPGNILVGVIDGKPVAKVIDFGLAKAMESTQRLTDQSLFTGIGQILGTLRYMSPEQASLDAVDIDTRTDVYALGVILYELMTGTTPLDDSSIKGQAALKILAIIREKEPAKPSSRLGSSTDEQKSSITNQRRTDSIRLNRVLAGDLDWIVMKALEKDRTRRYGSASDFAADVHRYLNSEPVVARPPSLFYRVRKFVRKNRVGVVAASLVTLALVGGIVGTSLATVRAWKAEQLAEGRLKEAVEARNLEQAQRQVAVANEILANENALVAQQEKQVAVTVREFLQNKLLKPASVWEQANSLTPDVVGQAKYNVTVRDLLDRAAAEFTPTSITSQFPDQPVVQSEILETIGQSLSSIGDHDRAVNYLRASVEILETALGPDQSLVIKKRIRLIMLYLRSLKTSVAIEESIVICDLLLAKFNSLAIADATNSDPAELKRQKEEFSALLNDVEIELENQLAMNGASIEVTLDTFEAAKILFRVAQASPKTKALYEQCLKEFGERDRRTLFSQFVHACTLHGLGQFQSAVDIYEHIYRIAQEELESDDLLLAGVRKVLANIYSTKGDFSQSLAFEEMVVEALVRRLGPDHPSTLINMRDMARAFDEAGQLDKALPLYEKMLVSIKAKLGPDHPDTLTTMNNLAMCYSDNNQLDKAQSLFEETLELSKTKFGTDHPETLSSMDVLASTYSKNGHVEEEISLRQQALELRKATLGKTHPETLLDMNNLAVTYQNANQMDKALPLYEQTLSMREAAIGHDDPETLNSMRNLAAGYQASNQPAKSLPLREKVLELSKKKLGPNQPETLNDMEALADGYKATNQLDKALLLLEQTLKLRTAKLGADHSTTLTTMNNLAVAQLEARQFDKALPLLEKVTELNRAKLGPDNALLLANTENLAMAYLESGEVEKAVTMLEQAFEHLRAKLGPNNVATLTIMNRLGIAQHKSGQLSKAVPLLEQTLELRKGILGADHPDTLASTNNLAMAYLDNKQPDKALPLLQETVEKLKTQLGADHPNTLHCMNNLATSYRIAGQLENALPLYEETLGKMRTIFGPDDEDTRLLEGNLLSAYVAAGEADRFETLLQELLEEKRKLLPAAGSQLASLLSVGGKDLLTLKRPEAAEPLLREALGIRQTSEPDKWSTFNTQSMLGAVLMARSAASTDDAEKARFLAEAEHLLVIGYEGMKQREATIPPQGVIRIPEALDRLVELYTILNKPDEVKKYSDLRTAYPKVEDAKK